MSNLDVFNVQDESLGMKSIWLRCGGRFGIGLILKIKINFLLCDLNLHLLESEDDAYCRLPSLSTMP